MKANFEESRINLSYLKNNSGGRIDFIEDIIKTFLRNEEKYSHHLKEIFSANDQDELRFFCHKIKSNYATLGINEGIRIIDQLKTLSLTDISPEEKDSWLNKLIEFNRDVKNELFVILNKQDYVK